MTCATRWRTANSSCTTRCRPRSPTGDIRGYEALLRWKHPTRGIIPPIEFIPLAEENGLILPLGEWVLRTACAKAASWEHPYKVAVNLSPVQFAHADLPSWSTRSCSRPACAGTGSSSRSPNPPSSPTRTAPCTILRRIKALGVTIAIDDFGTGYSSLETLRAFPFDKIKLDRSFMSEVETSPQAKAIIRAVLALGQSLHIPVLAEGVETHEPAVDPARRRLQRGARLPSRPPRAFRRNTRPGASRRRRRGDRNVAGTACPGRRLSAVRASISAACRPSHNRPAWCRPSRGRRRR